MRQKITLVLMSLVLILTVLNFEYSTLSSLDFSKKEYLDLAIIVICIVAIFFDLNQVRKSTPQKA